MHSKQRRLIKHYERNYKKLVNLEMIVYKRNIRHRGLITPEEIKSRYTSSKFYDLLKVSFYYLNSRLNSLNEIMLKRELYKKN